MFQRGARHLLAMLLIVCPLIAALPTNAAVQTNGERVMFTYLSPDAQTVIVRGSWNNWGQPIACIRDADGRWIGLARISAGSYQYYFVINDHGRVADPENPQRGTDAKGFPVSLLVITARTGAAPAPAPTPVPAATPTATTAATLPPAPTSTADGVVFTVDAPGANLVEVLGSWSGWSQPTAMTKGSDGKWKATIKLAPGDYEFKFRKDGDWDALNTDNRKVKVGADGKATFGAAPAVPAAGGTEAAAAGPIPPTPPGTDFAKTPVVVLPDDRLLFGVNDPFAGTVKVGGEFNSWTPDKFPLTRDPDGTWRGVLSLKEGKYKWKFVTDGQWENGDDHRLGVIRGKSGHLEILPTSPAFNTPYNSRIFFSGRFFGKAMLRQVPEGEQFDTGRVRFAPTEIDFRPRLTFTAGDKVDGYMEAEVNRLEGKLQTQFSEGRVTLTENWGDLFVFRRTRALDFNNPMRSLDHFRDTLDDKLYFTYEDRPPEHWFGRQFNIVRRNAADNAYNYTYSGWQGVAAEMERGRFKFQALGSDHVQWADDLYAARTTWNGDFIRIGGTYVHHELPRGLQAERVPGQGISIQNSAFLDTDGGFFRYPGTTTSTFDINALIFNFDGLAFFKPNGRNREQWWGSDIRIGHDTRNLFFEIQGYDKDFSFVAFENGDGLRPDGSQTFYDDGYSKNFGEYLLGGRERRLSALGGGLFHITPQLGLEVNYRYDDGTAKTMDRNRNVVDVTPSAGTFTGRLRYKSDKLYYSLEGVHRSVRDFPNTVFQQEFDNNDFTDVSVIGGTNLLQFKQDLAFKLYKWGFSGGQRYRRYDLLGTSPVETNELKGMVTYDLTSRLTFALTGRTKSYSLPNSTAFTSFPNRPQRFSEGGIRALYRISQFVNLNAGFGVNQQNDEDLEEGQLFVLREGLARARRGINNGGSITRTLDQVMYAEKILSNEARFEINFDARF